MENLIEISEKGRVLYLTLNRAEKRNAFSASLVNELKSAFRFAEENKNCKVIILKANGTVFSAGADLDYLKQLQQNTYQENLQDSSSLAELFKLIYAHKKIVIAQVEGHAIAGGCGLATVADFTYATPASQFGFTEVKIGFIPAIVSVFALRKLGELKAKELLFTGKLISSEEAKKIGLINDVCSPDEIEKVVFELAMKLCEETSANSLTLTKELINQVQEMKWQEAIMYAAEMNAKCRAEDDCKRGIQSFLNKEKIIW